VAAPLLKSHAFRREREATWRKLEGLVGRIEKSGLRSLDSDDLASLPVLYRATLSSLSVARSISLDRNLLEYLEALSQRAYLCVYTNRRHMREAVSDFLLDRLPSAVRRFRWHVALAALMMLLGILAGYFLVTHNPESFHAFVDSSYSQGRGPEASREDLARSLGPPEDMSTDLLGAFSGDLFVHNATIALFSFALGFAAGLPVFLALLRFGLLIGAFFAVFARQGLGWEFGGWLAVHGTTEVLGILLASAGGIALAGALLFPGRHARLESLARRGREAGALALGAVMLLLVAGLLEGLVREQVIDTASRYWIGGVALVLWGLWFGLVGRGRREAM
jgi:uncharacterized membrane protein SpoIIM required for sporulation